MSSSVTTGKHSVVRRVLAIVVPLLLVVGGTLSYLAYSGNAVASAAFGTGTSASSQVKVEFSVTINHQEQKAADFIWLTRMALRGQYWSASCYFFCNGVSYSLDPTITTEGIDWIQCKLFGADATLGGTCAATVSTTDVATVIAVSTVAATGVGDTYSAPADSCGSGSVTANNANGFTPAVAALTTPAASGAPSVTTAAAVTFTASGTVNNLQTACLLTELSTGANPLVLADGSFGPDSLISGNTLAITWQITTS